LPGAHSNKKPPCIPNPSDTGEISINISFPQSEHLQLNDIVDFGALSSNNFLRVFISNIVVFF
jgi:hypothetical protein